MGQTMVTITCAWCGVVTEKVAAEVRRQLNKGKTNFFCSASCAGNFGNYSAGKVRTPVEKTCPNCGKLFTSRTGAKAPTFCSRSCASAGSVNEARRAACERNKKYLALGNTPKERANALWSRESWKYAKVQALLDFLEEDYEFEFPVGRHIFDVALLERKVLVEFDGTYHSWAEQQRADAEKAAYAEEQGWRVERVKTPPNRVIEAEVMHPILKYAKELT